MSRYYKKYKRGDLKANNREAKRERKSEHPLVELEFLAELDRHKAANKPMPTWEEKSLIARKIAHDLGEEARFQGRHGWVSGVLTRSKEATDALTLAASYSDIGDIYAGKGDMDRALECYQRVLIIEERDALNSMKVAATYSNIGNIFADKGDLEKTWEHYQRALTIQERDAPNSLTVAASYSKIGNVYYKKGEFRKALEHYQCALTIQEQDSPNSLIVAVSYNNIGEVYIGKGDLEKAFELYHRAVTIQERDAHGSLAVATFYFNMRDASILPRVIRKRPWSTISVPWLFKKGTPQIPSQLQPPTT